MNTRLLYGVLLTLGPIGCGDEVMRPEVDQEQNVSAQPSKKWIQASMEPVQLTFGGPAYYSESPAWSPDGRSILFDRWSTSIYVSSLCVVSAQGGTPVQLTFGTNDNTPDWSHNGKSIVFESTRTGNNDIWLMDFKDQTARSLISLPRNDLDPKWSPDGKRIAFTSDSGGYAFETWIYSLRTGEARQLTFDGLGTHVSDWSPNGKWLALTKGGRVWLLPAEGGTGKQLTFGQEPVSDGGASWSPDGTTLAFGSSRTGNSEIWLMDVEGKNATQLTFSPSYDGSPAWSPDGSKIAFESDRTIYPEIWILKLSVKP